MLPLALLIFVAIHGLIHLMGFVKAFSPAKLKNLPLWISRLDGIGWFVSFLLFGGVAVSVALNRDWWWCVALPAILISQTLIIRAWSQAKFGSIANAILLLVTIVGFGQWQFNASTRGELHALVASSGRERLVLSQQMLEALPPVVQKWLMRSNVLGMKAARLVTVRQRGEMRTEPDGNWMKVEAKQWFTPVRPAFLWKADVWIVPGLYLSGRDHFRDGHGHMSIQALSLYSIVDSKGPAIDQGSMLRYLAEIVWFPSAALREYITWERVDSLRAKATMTYGAASVSGLFSFTSDGDPAGFEAMRYYDKPEGATLEKWVIEIDPHSYREMHGARIPTKSTVIWRLKNGDFPWFKLEITDLTYDAPLEE